MTMRIALDYIEKKTDSDKVRIIGKGVTVQHIVEHHERMGWTVQEIADAFTLTYAEIYAALAYYHDHKAEIDTAIDIAEQVMTQGLEEQNQRRRDFNEGLA